MNSTNLLDLPILVTSRYEDRSIQERAEKIELRILPKSTSGSVPVLIQEPKKIYDAILVSNDSLILAVWSIEAKLKPKNILVLKYSAKIELQIR